MSESPRLYASNQEASQALGVTMRSFSRACRRYGVETPYVEVTDKPIEESASEVVAAVTRRLQTEET